MGEASLVRGVTVIYLLTYAFSISFNFDSRSPRTWLESDLNAISIQWRDLLKTAGLQVRASEQGAERSETNSTLFCEYLRSSLRSTLPSSQSKLYNIEGDRLLVSVQKGWSGEDVRNFFLTRDEVEMVTWNNVETKKSDYEEF